MKLFDFLKKKKPSEKQKIEKPKEVVKAPKVKVVKKSKEAKKEIVVEEKKERKKIEPKGAKPRPKISGISYRVLKSVHISEKATDLVAKNQYTFNVWPRTNKIEIKKAVEDLYGVDVLDVKIIKVPQKKKRLGKITGWKKGYKKAIVKVKKGQKIEVLPR